MDRSTARIAPTGSDLGQPPIAVDRRAEQADKPPHEIENDIARTRVRLRATIEALERELAAERVVEKSREILETAIVAPSGNRVLAYAIPLALIATGLGWLFTVRRRHYRVGLPARGTEIPGGAVASAQTPVPASAHQQPIEKISVADERSGEGR
jgi:hypothetical protein